jgi:DNA-binding NarL/FixJ family response regulator
MVESGQFAGEWARGRSMAAADAIREARAILEAGHDWASSDVGRPRLASLTPREREVLRLLAQGIGDKEIAVALGMSRRTASKHVAAILGKLEVESRTAAVAHALREGLLEPSRS